MPITEAVTLCIAAHDAESFLAETLAAARAQTWPNLHIVVSVDLSTDRTVQVARDFAGSGAASVLVQTDRLGWVRNINAALEQVRTPFAMILPHDDVPVPTYVGACVEALCADPGAVAAYSDVETFGERGGILIQPSVVGTGIERVESFLRHHFAAIAFRAVFDVRRAPRYTVPTHAVGDFAADTLWMARMVCQGDIVRVAQPLYRKRYHEGSAQRAWASTGEQDCDDMWIAHCVELAWEMVRMRPALIADQRFWNALLDRVSRRGEVHVLKGGIPDRLRDQPHPIREMLWAYRTIRCRPVPYAWMRTTFSPDGDLR